MLARTGPVSEPTDALLEGYEADDRQAARADRLRQLLARGRAAGVDPDAQPPLRGLPAEVLDLGRVGRGDLVHVLHERAADGARAAAVDELGVVAAAEVVPPRRVGEGGHLAPVLLAPDRDRERPPRAPAAVAQQHELGAHRPMPRRRQQAAHDRVDHPDQELRGRRPLDCGRGGRNGHAAGCARDGAP
ncbi:MAG: hypothetical protein AVDCRST_MAG13-2432 [uncultured Solirubrobacteraceae bacterium]|uniref:Uncharacterized protein n=1 Tax=uncultured Solirubrobacteraceae bacterium TaxID=1162706 RepID=A0A6J4ST03_9ACTN|nr:MAG: hypothetical protein AVDCRST_MAG13-2432 [uncultured Solirubrobacteraceae bacterium]